MQHATLIGEIEAWLLAETLKAPDIVRLFDSLCIRLHGAGLPLDRAALTWPTLHPLFQAEQIFWRRGEPAKLEQYAHGLGRSEAFTRSPFAHALENGLTRLRRRLTGPEALTDFPVLAELREKGFTDYLLTATDFHIARVGEFAGGQAGIMASWATRREGGFSADDMVALTRIQTVFAVACHASIQMRIMEALAGAYLGPTAARRVLAGDTKLGDGEMIRAVVWFSDLRGSSWLAERMPPDTYLSYLADYYACSAEPVLDAGGEVLDFIGDAVLGIFPVRGDLGGPEAVRAATRAAEAALDRLEAYRARDGATEMQFSIALALGEVMFGNIGVAARLSFSAIGSVVNTVTRIDRLSKELGRAVLVTPEIAQVEPERWVPVGPRKVTEDGKATPIFARACERDRFDAADLRARLARRLAG